VGFDLKRMLKSGVAGRHAAGNGLSVLVRGDRAWWEFQFRDRITKKTRTVTLGPARGEGALSLTDARDRRFEAAKRNRAGTLPPATVSHAPVAMPAGATEKPAGRTFGEVMELYIADKAAAWKGGKSGDEANAHRRLLKTYIAGLPLATIDAPAVRGALAQWLSTPTAEKMRVKIASIWSWARANGIVMGGENPAAVLRGALPAVGTKVEHHPAMPWADVPAFMQELKAVGMPAAKALQWTILTATRAGETLGATWGEIQGDVWVIGERMKEGRPHNVPLTSEMLSLLGPRGADDDLIFGRLYKDRMRMLLDRRNVSVHGFRSTFVGWAAKQGYPLELRELALAHSIGDAVAKAYNREKLTEERRPMMEAWSKFATGRPALKVVA
jgi:integrase